MLYISAEWEWSVIVHNTQWEVEITLLKLVADKLHNKLMPDRIFSTFFLVQCALVAAAFLGPLLYSVVFPFIFCLCGGGMRV